ncbi:hypothetical protein ACB092_01G426200 [Castanea dentata]
MYKLLFLFFFSLCQAKDLRKEHRCYPWDFSGGVRGGRCLPSPPLDSAPNYTFAPFSKVETYDKSYAIAEIEKASAYMKHAIRENEEDYTFSPNNLVFNDFETKNKGCLDMDCLDIGRTIKVFKDNISTRQIFRGICQSCHGLFRHVADSGLWANFGIQE